MLGAWTERFGVPLLHFPCAFPWSTTKNLRVGYSFCVLEHYWVKWAIVGISGGVYNPRPPWGELRVAVREPEECVSPCAGVRQRTGVDFQR